MIAFVSASALSYLINSRAGRRPRRHDRPRAPKWEAVRAALLDAGFWKALWIFHPDPHPPPSPFAAANFVFGTIRAPLIPFLLGTLIGMAPRTGAVVWAASHASTLNFSEARNIWSTC
jgi:uncharacterized membrane protein YdjX (TVP38/TMEM64 family)